MRSTAEGSASLTFEGATVFSYRSAGSVPFAASAASFVARQVAIGPKGPAMESPTMVASASSQTVRGVGIPSMASSIFFAVLTAHVQPGPQRPRPSAGP